MAVEKIRRQALGFVEQAKRVGERVNFREFTEKTFHERWITEKYGGVKNVGSQMGKGLQIGGQAPGGGPDVLKHIKKFDSKNSSGAYSKALDIMQKLQDNSTRKQDLFSSIQPLQNILGGGLYQAMVGAGSAAKSQEKAQEAQPEDDIIARLIAAAMECTARKVIEDRDLAAEALTPEEIARIATAYYTNSVYESTIMPQTFVACINELIPMFRAVA